MPPVQVLDLLAQDDGFLVALVALMGGRSLGREHLGLAGLLEHHLAFGERGLRLCPALPGPQMRVPIAGKADEALLGVREAGGRIGHGIFGDLEAARACAVRLEPGEGRGETAAGRARVPVGTTDGAAEALAERFVTSGEIVKLVMADGRSGSQERGGRDAADGGKLARDPGLVLDQPAVERKAGGATELAGDEPAVEDALVVLPGERELHRRRCAGLGAPGAQTRRHPSLR